MRIDAIAICFIILVMASGGCSHGSDEEQIRAVISSAEKAAEARNTSDVIEWVDDGYRDDQGNDKAQLRNILRAYFITHPKIELLVRIDDLKIETSDTARVRLELTMLGTRQADGSQTALAAESETLRIDFRRVGSKWRVVHADRGRE